MASIRKAPLSMKDRFRRKEPPKDKGDESADGGGKDKKRKLLHEARALGLDFIGAIIVLLIIVGALYAYTDNWPPLVVVQSGSMQHSEEVSYLGVIDTGDLVFVKSVGERDRVIPYTEGRARNYRTYDSYGDVIIFRPNGEKDRTAIIHRAVAYLEWNDTTYNLPLPITDIDQSLKTDLNQLELSSQSRSHLNERIGIVNRWTLENILNQYPDDPNHDINSGILRNGGYPLSNYLDFVPFSGEADVGQIGSTRWNITENSQYFEIAEVNGSLVLYAFLRMGGGFDVDHLDLEPDQRGKIYVEDYEWPNNNNLMINLADILDSFRKNDKEPHSGFITKGDKNDGVDQTSNFAGTDQPEWIEPVEKDWVIGKSVGEVPWFGIIKLKLEGKSDPPNNSVRNLWIAIAVIIALPFAVDLLYNLVFKRKDDEEEEGDSDKSLRKRGWFKRKKTEPEKKTDPGSGRGDRGKNINRSSEGSARLAPKLPGQRKK
ncbi:MAG: hypothetical protein ACMUIG_10680 [Thermoplasmatota archaeon]